MRLSELLTDENFVTSFVSLLTVSHLFLRFWSENVLENITETMLAPPPGDYIISLFVVMWLNWPFLSSLVSRCFLLLIASSNSTIHPDRF